MKHSLHRLKNGLPVLTVEMPSLESVTVAVWVRVGSRFEQVKIGGISHFLEHMVFKGTTKRPSAKIISEELDGLGAVANAGTSKDWTNFWIKVRSAKIEQAFDMLSDLVKDPLLKDEDINREKGVIVEEMGMYEDTPSRHIWDIYEQLIYSGSPLGRDIIGTRESVGTISKKDFQKHMGEHYLTSNMLVSVAGGVGAKKVVKLAEKYFSDFKKGTPSKEIKFASSQKKPKVVLSGEKREQAHFVLGFLGHERGHPDRYIESVLATILGGGMSSRLFTEIREKRGLAYSVSTGVDRYQDVGYMATYAGVSVKKADEAIKIVLDQSYGLASEKYPISPEELVKAKEYIKGHLALSLEGTSAVNSFFGQEQLFLGKVTKPDDVYEGIDKVTSKDVVRVAKNLFKPEKLSLAIIGPYKNSEKFEKLV